MTRIPFSARLMPRTRARLRDFRTDMSGQVQALRPIPAPASFHTASLEDAQVPAGDAAAVMEGRFARYGQTYQAEPDAMWTTALPSVRFAHWLHGFGWLPALVSGKDAKAAGRARELVDGWIAEYGRHHGFAWQPSTVAARLQNWLAAWSPALNTDHLSDAGTARRRAAARQARFLRANLGRIPEGPERIRAGVALTLYGLRLPGTGGESWRAKGLDRLGEELSAQILPDGGHISRSPATTLDILGWLRELDALMDARGIANPPAVARAIDRMEPMMAFFSHTDGGLAGFHGSGEGDPDRIKAILGDRPARPFAFAPQSRYHRLARGGTVIIADAGDVPPYPFDTEAHLSPLAFEMSVKAGRLVVNCAWGSEQPASWREPVRATAAHSTLVLSGRSAGKLADADAGVSELLGARPVARGPGPIRADRREAEQGILLEASHSGYATPTGLVHARRLFLSESGEDLRGEDALDLPVGESAVFNEEQPFAVRFHIHPDVEARLGGDGKHVRLLRDGDPDGEWVFLCGLGEEQALEVEPSAYLGGGDTPRHCDQIVLRGRVKPGARMSLRWALRARRAIDGASKTDDADRKDEADAGPEVEQETGQSTGQGTGQGMGQDTGPDA